MDKSKWSTVSRANTLEGLTSVLTHRPLLISILQTVQIKQKLQLSQIKHKPVWKRWGCTHHKMLSQCEWMSDSAKPNTYTKDWLNILFLAHIKTKSVCRSKCVCVVGAWSTNTYAVSILFLFLIYRPTTVKFTLAYCSLDSRYYLNGSQWISYVIPPSLLAIYDMSITKYFGANAHYLEIYTILEREGLIVTRKHRNSIGFKYGFASALKCPVALDVIWVTSAVGGTIA